jgi:hypothetical protein
LDRSPDYSAIVWVKETLLLLRQELPIATMFSPEQD